MKLRCGTFIVIEDRERSIFVPPAQPFYGVDL